MGDGVGWGMGWGGGRGGVHHCVSLNVNLFFFFQYICYKDGQIANRS